MPNVELFQNDLSESFIGIAKDGITYHSPIKSKRTRDYLWNQADSLDLSIGDPGINTVQDKLSARARASGLEYKVFNRIGKLNDCFYYKLGSKIVEISSDGWPLTDKCPIRFHQSETQKNQVMPSQTREFSKVFKYLNLTREEDRLLFTVYCVSCLMHSVEQGILIFRGPQGSAKSHALSILVDLVDPCKTYDMSMTRDTEFIRQCSHRHLLPIDNASSFKDEFADRLCRIVTGAGISNRVLYTNDESMIKQIQKPVAISCIPIPSIRADFLDRSIILNLAPISQEGRRSKMEIKDSFQKDLPEIFGGLLDILSACMQEEAAPERLPRLADFGLYGYRCSRALSKFAPWEGKYSPEELSTLFLDTLSELETNRNEDAIEGSEVGRVVLYLLGIGTKLAGTPSEVHQICFNEMFRRPTDPEPPCVSQYRFPDSSASFRRELDRISPALEKCGIEIIVRRSNSRYLEIRKK